MLLDFDRADRIGEFAELPIDREEDRTLRVVLVGMLREAKGLLTSATVGQSGMRPPRMNEQLGRRLRFWESSAARRCSAP
jgi:hypothetical protein